ncbi:protein of unknown function (plasmid) [Caballeronia sp. S22]
MRTTLDVSLTDLFSKSASEGEEKPEARREGSFVRRSASRPKFSVQASGLRKELLTPEGQHDLQFMLIHFDPGTSSSEALMARERKAEWSSPGSSSRWSATRPWRLSTVAVSSSTARLRIGFGTYRRKRRASFGSWTRGARASRCSTGIMELMVKSKAWPFHVATRAELQ